MKTVKDIMKSPNIGIFIPLPIVGGTHPTNLVHEYVGKCNKKRQNFTFTSLSLYINWCLCYELYKKDSRIYFGGYRKILVRLLRGGRVLYTVNRRIRFIFHTIDAAAVNILGRLMISSLSAVFSSSEWAAHSASLSIKILLCSKSQSK